MASHKSSIIKSIVWRIIGVFVLAAVAYFFTRKWMTTTLITIVHHLTFLLVFYCHERAWLKIRKPSGGRRHIVKAIVYEIILGMGLGGLIVYLFTGQWKKVSQITPVYTTIKLVMYYFNEKVWSRIENK